MPPVARRRTRPVPDRDGLIATLAETMSLEGHVHQPRVIWNPLPIEGKLDVMVIWARWRGISFEDRTAIIREACARYKADLPEKIYTAIGRTPDEAVDLGYLPIRIAPVTRRIEPEDWARIDEAMIAEGAFETEQGLQLRFADFDEAQGSFLRLQERVPGPFWTIVEEVVKDY